MKDYTCTVCGYVYSETMGIPGIGIAPGTLWEDLPDDWTCPLCGATKAEFVEQSNEADAKPQSSTQYETSSDMLELTPLQASALCSNLARGCDMLEKKEESALFTQLADYFKKHAQPIEAPDSHTLHALIENDLRSGIYAAYNLALKENDRGALRALAWNKKVTKILNSLMIRYQQQGISMTTNTNIYVCTICGFVYIGDAPPVRCPVCKAPQQKMEKVEGRAS